MYFDALLVCLYGNFANTRSIDDFTGLFIANLLKLKLTLPAYSMFFLCCKWTYPELCDVSKNAMNILIINSYYSCDGLQIHSILGRR